MLANLRALVPLPRPDSDARRARPQGAVSRVGPRVFLVVHQPAAAAADLLVRLLDGDDGARDPRTRAVRVVHVLRHSAVDLVLRLDPRSVERADPGGNLIKKVLFPAEVLPIVTVLANMVHFFLGLPILVAFLIYYRRPLDPIELLWFPVIVFVQLFLLLGLSLLVVGADRSLPRSQGHPRQPADAVVLRDADHLPDVAGAGEVPLVAQPQPDDAPRDLVSGGAVLHRAARALEVVDGAAVGSVGVFFAGYFVFDRLRDTFAEEV